ncbi:MAG: ABC transporter permease [Bacteroidia bacterium]
MFEKDNWQEIFATMSKNKLRTFLTSVSVAWGIFILIILLGAGRGLYNGAQSQFMQDAVNSINVEGGQTGMPYKGFKPGRQIQLTNEDFAMLGKEVPYIDKKSASFNGRTSKILSYKSNHAGFTVRSVMPEHCFLENASIVSGRFINAIDISQYRKVCAMGLPVKQELFKDEDPIGKFVDVDGIGFKVVGLFTDPGNNDNMRIYIPVTTAQRAFNGKTNLGNIWMSITPEGLEKSEEMVDQVRTLMARKYNFDPKDFNAIRVENWSDTYRRINNMLSGINIFIWIIGIFTLIAGIVGVSNIMMIIVKERTKEIGIRKAIGATPASIVTQIIMEAVFITAVAGYAGLLAGVGVLELANKIGIDSDFFKRPEINFSVAISATCLIILSGAVAGFIPSLRAARVEPVIALRDQ